MNLKIICVMILIFKSNCHNREEARYHCPDIMWIETWLLRLTRSWLELCVTSVLTGQMEFWWGRIKRKFVELRCFSSLALLETHHKTESSTSPTSETYMEIETSTKINDDERIRIFSENIKLDENLEFITFCHEMDEYQIAFGESCINVQRNFSNSLMSRDILLERLFQKSWLTFTVIIWPVGSFSYSSLFDRILVKQRMISHSISNQSFWIHLTSVDISHQNWAAVSAREGLSTLMTKMISTRRIFGCGTWLWQVSQICSSMRLIQNYCVKIYCGFFKG